MTVPRLTAARFVAALERFRAHIAEGAPLNADDSDEIGNKYTDCSWGMCSLSPLHWPVEDRLRTLPNGHVHVKELPEGALCPLDRRTAATGMGCFWTCRVFQPERRAKVPSREQALALYDKRLEEWRAIAAREADARQDK